MPNKTVKHRMFIVAVIALGSSFTLAQAADSQASAGLSLTGTVTCEARITHRYTCLRNQTQQTCTLACVEQGSQFVLMVGDKPYLLKGDGRELKTYAGGKATLTGLAVNDRIEVRTASSAKHNMPRKSDAEPSSMGANLGKRSTN